MKLKRIILLAVALVMCISLCSCLDLDAEREKHAKLQDDGSILLNGHKYVLLPECEELSPNIKYSTEAIRVTDPDVPLLLASIHEKGGYWISEDGVFILSETYFDYSFSYYCREDYYDKVTAAMEEEKEYYLCYEHSNYDHNIGDYVSTYRFLTDTEADVIEETLKQIEKSKPSEIENSYYNQYFDFSVDLERRTKDSWFSIPNEEGVLQLCYSTARKAYYLRIEEIGTYDYELHRISGEYNSILDNLMSDYLGVEIDW